MMNRKISLVVYLGGGRRFYRFRLGYRGFGGNGFCLFFLAFFCFIGGYRSGRIYYLVLFRFCID